MEVKRENNMIGNRKLLKRKKEIRMKGKCMLKKIQQERKRKDRKVTNTRGFILHAGDMKMSVM